MNRPLLFWFSFLFAAPLLAQDDGVEITSIARQTSEIVLTFRGSSGPESSFILEHSTNLKADSWVVREAEIVSQADGNFRLSTSSGPDLAGYFRIRSTPGSVDSALRVVINEIMAKNDTTLEDGAGDFPDWIELFNTGDTVADLGGYGLSDNENRLGKWLFPSNTSVEPGGFLLVFASGKEDEAIPANELHADFKISNGNEPIILTNPEGEIIDRLDPGPLAADASMGRARDDIDILYQFEANETSPGGDNHTFLFGAPDPFIQAPRFSTPGGVYKDAVTVQLIAPKEGDVIRYSTEGAEPFHTLFSSNSTLYSEPIVIDRPTVIRAKVLGKHSSRTVTATYLVGVEHSLPVLSMAADPENFEFEDGYLYGMGSALSANGTVSGSFPYSSSNAWKRDREVEASLEMFEPDDEEGFAMNVGVKIFGGWGSRGYPQKSMAIFARQIYGYGRIRHRIFPDKDVDSFESLVLRNSGNDNQSTWLTPPRSEIRAFSEPVSYGSYFVNSNFTLFRDAMVQSLARETGLDTQGYRPAVLYLNGDYWGLYNIREKMTEHYVESNHNVPGEEVDLIEGYGGANSGSATVYNRMRTDIDSRDMNDPEHYQFVEDNYLDMGNFIDYNLTVIWGQNFDIGNIKCWRPQRDEGGQFRWLVYDQDYAFSLWKPEVYLPAMKRDFADYENMFEFHTNTSGGGTGWPNAGGRTMLLREMLESDVFRERLIQRCADLLNHLWSADRVVDRIDAMASVIRPEIPRHLERWSWAAIQARGFGHPHKEEDEPLTLEHWERNVEVMRAFGRERPDQLRGHLMDHFQLAQGTSTVSVTINDTAKGTVMINTLTVPSSGWTGVYFKDFPPVVRAIPNAGHTFTGWSGALDGDDSEATLSLTNDTAALTANFE